LRERLNALCDEFSHIESFERSLHGKGRVTPVSDAYAGAP
jgi:hypothetical protein